MYPGGIIFLKTTDLKRCCQFYESKLGFEIWLEQPNCTILKCNNLMIGFIGSGQVENQGIITLFYPSKQEVDDEYLKLKNIAIEPPKNNEKYNIYQFFARDLEGRLLEFQSFNHAIDW